MKSAKSVIFCVLLFSMFAPLYAQDNRPDALLLLKERKYREAIEVCLQELNETPRRMDSYVVLGWAYLSLRDFDNTIKYSLKALTISRADARVMETLGEAYYYTGKYTESLSYFQEYVKLLPAGKFIGDVYAFMGEIFLKLGEYNHADVAFSTAVYHRPDQAKLWGRLGYSREMAKDYQFALEAYDRALKLNDRLDEALRGKDRVKSAMM